MANEELLVWYGEGYAEELGIDLEHDPNMPVVDPSKTRFFTCYQERMWSLSSNRKDRINFR